MKKAALGMFILAVLFLSSAFGQTPAFNISGKVINEKTGEPIAGASVSFQPSMLMVYIEPVLTGPDGSYSKKLNDGSYYVIVKHPGFEAFIQKEIKITSDAAFDFKLTPVTLPVEAKNYVKGTVFQKETNQPLARAFVALFALDGRKFYVGAASDKMGNFILSNIPEGDYYLNVSMTGYLSYKDTTRLKIAQETKIQDLKIYLAEDTTYENTLVRSVKFYIYKVDASSGTKTGAANAKIHLYGPTGNSYDGITDMNGVFILNEAVRGIYKVMVSDGTNTEYTSVDIKSDGETFEIELKAPVPVAQGTVKGKVYNTAGSSPLQGAAVYLIPAGTAQNDSMPTKMPHFGTVTNAGGEYSLSVIPGDYYVACSYYGNIKTFAPVIVYYDNVRKIEEAKKIRVVKDAVVSDINFGMDVPVSAFAEVTISGKLGTATGEPVNDAKLVVYDRTNNNQTGSHIKTGPDGKYYAVIRLTKGEHDLILGAYSGNYQAQFFNGKPSLNEADIIKLDITGDKASIENIDFKLTGYEQTGSYSISGRVIDEENNPVAGVNVELFGSFNKSAMVYTDSTGNYKISGLPEGKYIVGFFAKGYMPQYYKEALTWEKASPVVLNSNAAGVNAVIKKTQMHAMNGFPQGKVAGKISDMNSMPVSGARILLMSQDGTMIDADMSDSQGEYYLSGAPAGTYKLIASRVNYQSKETEISLALDKAGESTYNINLSTTTGIKDLNEKMNPAVYVLENNYPNPFNPSTKIRFSLPEQAHVTIEVYSVLGQKISTLIDDNMSAGYHEVSFNAAGLPSGIYIYKMSGLNFTESKLMHLLK